jgi:hypothetical protein
MAGVPALVGCQAHDGLDELCKSCQSRERGGHHHPPDPTSSVGSLSAHTRHSNHLLSVAVDARPNLRRISEDVRLRVSLERLHVISFDTTRRVALEQATSFAAFGRHMRDVQRQLSELANTATTTLRATTRGEHSRMLGTTKVSPERQRAERIGAVGSQVRLREDRYGSCRDVHGWGDRCRPRFRSSGRERPSGPGLGCPRISRALIAHGC